MIRVATPDDFEAVCGLLRVMHAENGVGRVNEAKAQGVISQVIKDRLCVVIEHNGEIVGSVGMYMDSWWYSNEMVLFDQWFFVHPDHRKDGYATQLIDDIKIISNKNKVPFVVTVGTAKDTLPKLKFFRKHLTPFGGGFIHFPEAA